MLGFYKKWNKDHDRINIGYDEADKLQFALRAIGLLGTKVPAGLLEKLSAFVKDDSCVKLAQKKLERDLDESRGRVKVLENLAVQAGLSAKPPKSMTILEMWDLCESLARACKTRFHCTLDAVVMITAKSCNNNPESGIEMERVDQARLEVANFLKQFCDTMDGIHDDLVNQHGNVCVLEGRYAQR